MSDTHLDVSYVASLARLELSDDEITRFQAQLDAILGYVEQLSTLSVEGIEPTAHPAPVYDRMDPDQPHPGLTRDAFLRNAPDSANGQVRVPKVVADA